MAIEYEILKDRQAPCLRCPKCWSRPFIPFLRGQVESPWRKFLGRPYMAVICTYCHEIVGHELTRKEVKEYATAQRKVKESNLREY